MQTINTHPNVVSFYTFVEVNARKSSHSGLITDEFCIARELEPTGVSLLGLLYDIVQEVDQKVREATHRSMPSSDTKMSVLTAMPVDLKLKPIPTRSKLHIGTP